eukprot:m.136777 g.136777  ORF g.136777 m.136777 type:complete len:268 (+) comp15876_c0_seq6:511-1314(+)
MHCPLKACGCSPITMFWTTCDEPASLLSLRQGSCCWLAQQTKETNASVFLAHPILLLLTFVYIRAPLSMFWYRFVLRTLEADRTLHRGGVVLAPISNGGLFCFRHMVTLLNSGSNFLPLKAKLGGVIIDSAPCYMTLAAGAKAFCGALNVTNPVLKVAVYFTFYTYELCYAVWGEHSPQKFWHAMRTWDLGPQVAERYLVSDIDTVCDYKAVASLVKERMAAKPENDIQLVMFPGSPHVRHLLSDSEKYRSTVSEIIARTVALAKKE